MTEKVKLVRNEGEVKHVSSHRVKECLAVGWKVYGENKPETEGADEKALLVEALTERGIKFDARAGVKKLQDLLDAADADLSEDDKPETKGAE